MKKITLMAAVLGIFLCSCDNSTSESKETESTEVVANNEEEKTEESSSSTSSDGEIVGTWKLSDVSFGAAVPEGQEEVFQKMVNEMKESTRMTFNNDGTYENKTSMMGMEKIEKGKYRLEGNTLTSISEDGREDVVELVELSSNKFIISTEEEGNKITLTFAK